MKGKIPAPAKALTLLDVYPVGSIYISTSATNPGTLFGGTWEQLEDRFLLGAGNTYSSGATGGSAAHTLTESQLPKITGNINATFDGGTEALFGSAGGVFSVSEDTAANSAKVTAGSNVRYKNVYFSLGNNQPHNNMPPYLVVYMWRRTA